MMAKPRHVLKWFSTDIGYQLVELLTNINARMEIFEGGINDCKILLEVFILLDIVIL